MCVRSLRKEHNDFMKNLTADEKLIWSSAFTNAINIYRGVKEDVRGNKTNIITRDPQYRYHSLWALQDANYAVECYRLIQDDTRIIK
jgi:hypothetical protein